MAGKQMPDPKDTAEVKDYVFDFKPLTHHRPGATSDLLEVGETIDSYTITVPAGMVLDSDSENDGAVTIWLSGGSKGQNDVTCTIITSAGRTYVRTMLVLVEDL